MNMAAMNSHVKDLVALVTGGASGLGEAAVRRFIGGGAKVAILDLPNSNGAQIAKDLGPDCIFIHGNVCVESDLEGCMTAIKQKFNKLDVVLNCAGVFLNLALSVEDCEDNKIEGVKKMFEVNTIGTYKVTSAAARLMKDNVLDEDGGRGVIINLASLASTDAPGGYAAYAGTKGAVVSMTLPLARDLAKYGIRVNSISPGIFVTPMNTELLKVDGLMDAALFPKRAGKPDEVAALIQHIVENKYMNAAVIRLDAGFR